MPTELVVILILTSLFITVTIAVVEQELRR